MEQQILNKANIHLAKPEDADIIVELQLKSIKALSAKDYSLEN